MINFSFGLSNPWCKRWNTVYYKERLFSNHKSGDVQIVKDNTIISIGFRFSTQCDHAGIGFDIGLFGYSLMITYNDTRHWNDKEGRYYIYDKAGNAS